MKSSLLRTAVAGIVSFLLFSAAAEAQIVNGSFEATTPAVSAGSYLQVNAGGSGLTGWQVGGHDIDVVSGTYSEQSGSILFNAHSGNQSVDMTGTGNSGANTISQTFATTFGQTYALSFFLGNLSGTNYNLPASVSLVASGNPPQIFTNAATTPGMVNWAGQTYLFTATNASTAITFTNNTLSGDNFVGLDTIALAAVPEPASLAVWGAVSALGAAFGWRRRGRAS